MNPLRIVAARPRVPRLGSTLLHFLWEGVAGVTALWVRLTGGYLAHRTGRLLRQPRSAPRTFSGAGMATAVVLPAIAAAAMFGQPASRPRFEVASIKPAGAPGPNMIRPLPNGLTGTAPLKLLIERAYGVQSFQIAGGPQWIDSERYAIDARAAGNASQDQIRLMVRPLLEERFQLKIHRETRELPLFHLVVARGGSKLPATKEGGCTESTDPDPELTGRMAPPGSGPAPRARCGGLRVMLQAGGARIFGGKIPMPELVRMLSVVLHRMVVDTTGITGVFDVQLDFLPDDSTPLLPPPPPDAAASNVMSPSIFSALPGQLGLRLEAAKGPVEVIVIDRAERPSAN